MIQFIDSIDKKLLIYLNGTHTPFWDAVMITFTDKFFWFPFYALLLGFLIWKFQKKCWLLFPCIALLITASDQFASTIVKPLAGRLRPCHDASVQHLLYLAKGCGGTYGFISSHAANSFAIACFLSLILKNKWLGCLLFGWAAMVSYSRVYLGAHYPGDILCGGVAGVFFAFIFYRIYCHADRRFFRKGSWQNTHEI